MRRFSLFLDRGREHAAKKATSVQEQLLSLDAEPVDIEKHGTVGIRGKNHDYVLMLSGDETLTYAARGFAGSGVPLVSVNFGHLGYPTVASSDEEIPGVLEKLIVGDCVVEERMILNGKATRNGHENPHDHE